MPYFVALGILGAVCLASGRAFWANLAWVFANAGLAFLNFKAGSTSQGILFCVYLVLSGIGTVKWRPR